jgi:hypothetical protein
MVFVKMMKERMFLIHLMIVVMMTVPLYTILIPAILHVTVIMGVVLPLVVTVKLREAHIVLEIQR